MTAHDPALVAKATRAIGRVIQEWSDEPAALRVLDAVADDLREQGRAEVRAAVEAAITREGVPGYEPWDREKHLGKPPWKPSNALTDWEDAHGHDVRTKCYQEYGCRVCSVDVDELRDALAGELP